MRDVVNACITLIVNHFSVYVVFKLRERVKGHLFSTFIFLILFIIFKVHTNKVIKKI